MRDDCIFCEIVAGKAPHKRVKENTHSIVIVPKDPHTPGHVLVLPRAHLDDATQNPNWAGVIMRDAVRYLEELETPGNILTSVGAVATQTVFHLHVHVIPRGPDDGLYHDWPWMRDT